MTNKQLRLLSFKVQPHLIKYDTLSIQFHPGRTHNHIPGGLKTLCFASSFQKEVLFPLLSSCSLFGSYVHGSLRAHAASSLVERLSGFRLTWMKFLKSKVKKLERNKRVRNQRGATETGMRRILGNMTLFSREILSRQNNSNRLTEWKWSSDTRGRYLRSMTA